MITEDRRRHVRDLLLDKARSDDRVTGAALTGSAAREAEDRLSGWTSGISGLRDHVLALGLPVAYAKGADRLPAAVTAPLSGAMVGDLDPAELRRALGVATRALLTEVGESDQDLAGRLSALLH
ncbi:hypothetical protein [Nonomuraea sp. bgisy101]